MINKKSLATFSIFLLFVLVQFNYSWEPTRRLTFNSGFSNAPVVAVDSNQDIHVVWNDDFQGNHEIYYRKSTDGGKNWSNIKRLTYTWERSYFPAIAVDSSDYIHVVWYDYSPGNEEIYYKRSTDGGANWSIATRLTWNSGKSNSPEIVTVGNQVHVVWDDTSNGVSSNPEIYFKRSTNNGVTWQPIKRLTWNSGRSYRPAIAVDSFLNVLVAWEDDTTGFFQIYFKRSIDYGVTWSPLRRVTWSSNTSWDAKVTADQYNNIHVIWCNNSPGNYDIYYKWSTNGGIGWGTTQRLSWSSGDSRYPDILVNSNNHIYIAWQDEIGFDDEIIYKYSSNFGATWQPQQRLTWNSGDSVYLDMILDPAEDIHLVWEDDTPGNFEVFYKAQIFGSILEKK